MTEVMHVKFLGVDESGDPKAMPVGTLRKGENCAMDKLRRLVKRAGTTGIVKSILGGGSLSAAARGFSRGKDLFVADSSASYLYSDELAAWKRVAPHPPLRATSRGLIDSATMVAYVDVALAGDLLVTLFVRNDVATANSAFVHVKVENVRTGATVYTSQILDNGAGGRVLIEAGVAYIITATNGGAINIQTLTLATMTMSSQTLIVNDQKAGTPPTGFDAVIADSPGGRAIYVGYQISTGEVKVRYLLLSAPTTTVASRTGTTTNGGFIRHTLCISVGNGFVHVGSASNANSGAAYIATFNDALSSTTVDSSISLPGTNSIFVANVSATQLLLGVGHETNLTATTFPRFETWLVTISSNAKDASTNRMTANAGHPSKPFQIGGRWFTLLLSVVRHYGLLGTPAVPSRTSVVVEIETSSTDSSIHRHVATLENLTAWQSPYRGAMSQVAIATDGSAYVPAAFRRQENPYVYEFVRDLPVGWNLHHLELMASDQLRAAALGQGALLAGGAPAWCDGERIVPYGFAHAPIIAAATVSSGGSQVAGTYTYIAVYEWRDARGVLHRSIPSPPVSATTASTNLLVTLKVACSSISHKYVDNPAVSLTNWPTPVMVAIYRSTIAQPNVYYRLSVDPILNIGKSNPTTEVSIVDGRADSDITGGALALNTQPQLYTLSNELEDEPPPSLITCVTHAGRFAGIAGSLRTLCFSKVASEDSEIAPGFNAALTLAFATDKYALLSLDEKLVVWGERDIDVVHGDGPDASGSNGAWQVQRMQTDVGCTNSKSVVACPMGAMFQATNGSIHLLTRGLELIAVGKAVEDTLAAFPTITSAVLVANEEEVRFTCVAADGLTGIVIAYDYGSKAWFTRRYRDSSDTDVTGVPFVDALVVNGVYTLITAAGQVYRETTAHKLDGGVAFVAREIELADISPAGNQAWHRMKDVSVLGTSVTPHGLAIDLARDFGDYEQTEQWSSESDVTATGPLEQARATFEIQKCQAARVRLRELPPTDDDDIGTGDGAIFEGLAFRVGVKRGTPRLAAGQQGGD